MSDLTKGWLFRVKLAPARYAAQEVTVVMADAAPTNITEVARIAFVQQHAGLSETYAPEKLQLQSIELIGPAYLEGSLG